MPIACRGKHLWVNVREQNTQVVSWQGQNYQKETVAAVTDSSVELKWGNYLQTWNIN